MEHKKLIEAALFISPGPLDLNELGKITGINSMGVLKEEIEKLQKEYQSRGLEIAKTSKGFQMQVKPDLVHKVSHLTPHMDLSEGCRRTLALIVYKDPLKQSDVIKIQGNKAYNYVKQLIKRGLVKSEKKGHTNILSLTSQFETYFGSSRKQIKDAVKERLGSFKFSPLDRQKTLNEVTKEKKPEVKPEPEKPEVTPTKKEIVYERGVKFRKKEGIDEEGELVL